MNAAVRTLGGLAMRLLRQWWPQLLALASACGIVAATIAGGLGVGDSLTRSLRRLALARLGGIRSAVLAEGLFRAGLADETTARLRSRADGSAAATPVPALVPAIVMEVTLERAADGERAGASARATLLACDTPDRLGFSPGAGPPAADAVAINEVLAVALGVRVGEAVLLRTTKLGDVPADSPMGRRTAESWSRRLVVAEVLPAGGIGEFSLRPTQVTGGLAVTTLGTAQALVRRGEPVANAMFAVAGPARAGGVATPPSADAVRSALEPALDDLGLVFDRPPGSGAWRLSSRRLLLAPEADRAAERVLAPRGGRPTLVFLANALVPLVDGRPGPASIPYSTVVGVDSTSLPVGDLVADGGGQLPVPGPDEIVIDRWMADDLAAQGTPVAVGDRLEVRTFLPETLHGRVEEQSCTLRVSGIAAMRGAAVARDLVPEVEGITDEASIADWDPPFPFDRGRVRTVPPHDEDDRYWKMHGATPKAFVALAVARRLAGSRFGATTAWHVPAEAAGEPEAIRAALGGAVRAEGLGMRVVPLRERAEEAARGSTPFGSLFLALSSFIVVAGLLLEWLLFWLLVAARRRDIGILSAIGWPAPRVMRLLAGVAGVAVVAGVVTGTVLGPLWSRLLLGWLATAWDTGVVAGSRAAFGTATPAFSPDSLRVLLPAAAAAAAVSFAAVATAARRAARLDPLRLLKGVGEPAEAVGRADVGAPTLAAVGPLLFITLAIALAIGLAWWAGRVDPQAAVGLFFAAGCAALAGCLAGVRLLLRSGTAVRGRPLRTLADLSWRGLTHGRSRAFSVAAIVACAEFLIVAVSSFALQPPSRPHDRDAPTGGWTFIATFGSPTGIDPADPVARESLGLSDAERTALETCAITRIRSSAGDDASCVNLYAPTQPTVLGLDRSFIERGGFRFVAHAAVAPPTANPWTLLERDTAAAGANAAIPVVVDQATAQWALKLGGVGARFTLEGDDAPVACEIVGLLEPGILQGSLLVSERNFSRLFPRRSGYSIALVDAGPMTDAAASDRAARAIAAAWADAGVVVTRATDRLRSLQAVQNTFLAGFQALGTLGLVLGAAGVAAVQFQGVLERLGALGLLAAVGFTGRRLRLIIVVETVLMVVLGLAVGTLAGCLAVVPAFTGGRAGLPTGWIACTWAVTLLAAVAAGLAASHRVSRLAPARVLAAAE